MVKLTEKLLKEKAKATQLPNVKKLNFWGHQLTDVSILATLTPDVEVLSLSVNDISSLRHFAACMSYIGFCGDRIKHKLQI